MTWWHHCNLINAPHRFSPSSHVTGNVPWWSTNLSCLYHGATFSLFPTTSPFLSARASQVWAPKSLWWDLSADLGTRKFGQNKLTRLARCSREMLISLRIVPMFHRKARQRREGRQKARRRLLIGWANQRTSLQRNSLSWDQCVQIVRSELSHQDLYPLELFFTLFQPSLVTTGCLKKKVFNLRGRRDCPFSLPS